MYNGVRADVKRLEETAKLLGFSEESIIKLEDPTKDELEQFFNSCKKKLTFNKYNNNTA